MRILPFLALIFPISTVAVAADSYVDNILVEKAARKMYLRHGENIVKEYTIALGQNPIGAKKQEGDGKTPEGEYIISGRNPQSSYHLSLRISYPNEKDIAAAKAAGVSAGGDIMIHGFPNKIPNFLFNFIHPNDWTAGCIAVTDKEIDEIWRLVPDQTKIVINP